MIALQAVTVGDEVTELMAQLETDGEFAEQLFTHGLGVQVAEGLAEWLHWRVRRDLGIDETQGRRYSWGYPAIPEQSEHEKVDTLLGLEQIGMRLTGRLRADARAVHARGHRAPPRGDLLRHHERPAPAGRPQGPARRRHQGLSARPVAPGGRRRRRWSRGETSIRGPFLSLCEMKGPRMRGSPSWQHGRAGWSPTRSFARSVSAPPGSAGGAMRGDCIDSIAASTQSDTRR